jgi:predicted transcriptional regulator
MSETLTPQPDWYARLRASGRSMVWLADRLQVSRTHLHDVASGRSKGSPELLARIEDTLGERCPRCGFLP